MAGEQIMPVKRFSVTFLTTVEDRRLVNASLRFPHVGTRTRSVGVRHYQH